MLSPGSVLRWLALSAGPSMLLLAVTEEISRDLGSVPIVWVAPLALYLLSFVLTFREPPLVPWLLSRFWLEIAVVAVFLQELDELRGYVVVHLAALFAVAAVAHRRLYERAPDPRLLSAFYVAVAAGGWLGSAFVALVAHRIFGSFAEYPAAVALVAGALWLGEESRIRTWMRQEPRILLVASGAFLLAAAVAFQNRAPSFEGEVLAVMRNAYGRYRVIEGVDRRSLMHGSTVHGAQSRNPALRGRATAYYAPESPIGDVFRLYGSNRQILVVGLGAGTMAALRKPGDHVRFVELDPDVEALARGFFTYLGDCGADCEVAVGDARQWMVHDHAFDGAFDLLVIDAFSSDAIPTHLATREAVELYLRKLAPDGVLVFHISSRHYDLTPVLAAIATSSRLSMVSREKETNLSELEFPSTWVAMHRSPSALAPLLAAGWTAAPASTIRPWTDDSVRPLQALSRSGPR